ncbi:hypothetical protein J1P26_21880 [Neobacillus sp. MM2021_6]|uniref:hypothetical protein n=1 Tax=Bacillaceae TaxID=186817 RepID=UPI0014087D60|nr:MULTISPECIES: hypothetical protein [Bacillaceae]MBO0962357.1 hypothetical protein [Neobacillus sp. MM2021_6]NHC20840.1 hypothetical protein [Bacillus sp. MM2020_4]
MKPSFQNQLKQWQHKHQEPTPKKNKSVQPQPAKKKTEKLSDSDLKYLMGTGRPTYRRYKGSLRQK